MDFVTPASSPTKKKDGKGTPSPTRDIADTPNMVFVLDLIHSLIYCRKITSPIMIRSIDLDYDPGQRESFRVCIWTLCNIRMMKLI
jgi:hypothetical protein